MNYAAARMNMVEGQLRTNKVTDDAVLSAFLAVPRERFVTNVLSSSAYVDDDLPIGNDRYLMEPMVFARLLQLAAITPADNVLEIGSGTGYGTAVLARLAGKVVAVEQDPVLAAQARDRLRELGVIHIETIAGRHAAGHSAGAPYDVIVIEGAVQAIPDAIAAQLAEGGRLVAVLARESGMGQAMLMTRVNGLLSHLPEFDAAVPLLPGFERGPSFVF